MGQVVLADDDLDIDAEIVFVAEDLDDAAARILGGRGPVGDLAIDDQAFQILPGRRLASLPMTRSTSRRLAGFERVARERSRRPRR